MMGAASGSTPRTRPSTSGRPAAWTTRPAAVRTAGIVGGPGQPDRRLHPRLGRRDQVMGPHGHLRPGLEHPTHHPLDHSPMALPTVTVPGPALRGPAREPAGAADGCGRRVAAWSRRAAATRRAAAASCSAASAMRTACPPTSIAAGSTASAGERTPPWGFHVLRSRGRRRAPGPVEGRPRALAARRWARSQVDWACSRRADSSDNAPAAWSRAPAARSRPVRSPAPSTRKASLAGPRQAPATTTNEVAPRSRPPTSRRAPAAPAMLRAPAARAPGSPAGRLMGGREPARAGRAASTAPLRTRPMIGQGTGPSCNRAPAPGQPAIHTPRPGNRPGRGRRRTSDARNPSTETR